MTINSVHEDLVLFFSRGLYRVFGVAADFVGPDLFADAETILDEGLGCRIAEIEAVEPGKGERTAVVTAQVAGHRRDGGTEKRFIEIAMTDGGRLVVAAIYRTRMDYESDGMTDQDVLDYC